MYSVCKYFNKEFCIFVHRGYLPVVFFLYVVSLADFGSRMLLVS